MARVVSIATDLIGASRVDAMLTAAGHNVILARSLEEASLGEAELVVADLDVADPVELGKLEAPVIAYYSHVDVETRRAAEAAGIELVVPRSRMARELPQLAARLVEDR